MRPSRAHSLLVVATALTLFVFSFPTPLFDFRGADLTTYARIVFPSDIALALVVVAVVASVLTGRFRPRPGTALLLGLTVALAVASAFHPSIEGAQTVLRFFASGALAFALTLLTREERLLAVSTLAAAALAQLGLALAQMATRAPLGLTGFGELTDPFLVYGGAVAPRGTLSSQPALAGFALVVPLVLIREGFERARPYLWFVLAGLVSIPVALTYSRGAALGLGLACAALALDLRRRPRLAAAAIACLALAGGVTAFAVRDGWQVKVDARGIAANGRELLVEQSLELIASSPLVGVGPGRSVIALRERYPVAPEVIGYQPAHDFVLLAAVEGGIPAGALAAALLLVLAWRARRSPPALALVLAFLPVVLLDHWPYTYPQGLVLLGLWVGTLDQLSDAAAPATFR